MRSKGLGAAVLAVGLATVVAGAAPAPVAGAQSDRTVLLVSLQLAATRQHNFQGQLQYNCDFFFSNGRAVEGSPQFATAQGPAVGSLDFAHNRGEAFVKRNGWQVEALPPTHVRPVLFADLGIALQGRNVFLTGRITHRGSLFAGAGRRRLAVVRAAKRLDGTLADQHGKPVPNTFSFLAQGKLKMLPAMSRAIERTRCKNRRRNRLTRRLKPGYLLGRLTVGLRPDHASGLAGSVRFQPLVSTRGPDDDQPVGVEPSAGVSQDSRHILTAPITAGLPVPLTCVAGDECTPGLGTLGVGGGFDLVYAGRRTTVANITIDITGTPPDDLRRTIAGTLDGTPVTIATGSAFTTDFALTDEFLQRAGAALGTELNGAIELELLFTHTGP